MAAYRATSTTINRCQACKAGIEVNKIAIARDAMGIMTDGTWGFLALVVKHMCLVQ